MIQKIEQPYAGHKLSEFIARARRLYPTGRTSDLSSFLLCSDFLCTCQWGIASSQHGCIAGNKGCQAGF